MASARPRSLELLKKLVSFDTVSCNGNQPLIEWVGAYLEELGFQVHLIVDKKESNKINLYASIGPEDTPGVILSGHTDVVPVAGQDWATDPFTLTENDAKDRVYGRGTCDMKGFVAVCLLFAPDIAKTTLTMPVHIALSYDEEIGCLGVLSMIDYLKDISPKPRMCIVGEPTDMKVIVAHKGKQSFHVGVDGFSCHSSLVNQGVNAVEVAADLIHFLRGKRSEIEANGPFDDAFVPRFTSVHTGFCNGGTALNIVPVRCDFEFEMRHLPQHDPSDVVDQLKARMEDLRPGMKAVNESSDIHLERLCEILPLDTGMDEEVVTLVSNFAAHSFDSEEDRKRVTELGKVSFGTEAGRFQSIGISSVVCGPGSIEQAHKPNEFVLLDQLLACEKFMAQVVDFVSA